ncbi:MAG: bifunctional (p)ppGpp synthetase/guanosine-3',5'-bis(diphosphate) 3'-pyrophosphohydrolase, partial [Desulfobacterales bacterium]|nr:bifunctional (p)ppGpp synthetase/guanosine-3',5'-bis(diphosphate) 3'-pyrophosphohydrolase [Desulfobacterales bacterium]
ENIRKMLLAMANDIRVILIKLADRLHNMRTLQYHPTEAKQKKIAKETLDIYCAIASRLGIYWIKHELENTAFMYLNPEAYNEVKGLVVKNLEQREHFIKNVKELLREKLKKMNLECEVLGRFKKFYSIYDKMKTQNLEFEDIYDIIAFRIVLKSVADCYAALGHVHSLWKPIDAKFKDYIARPKSNMYQSLHTTVLGPDGERVEIQIRTDEMDKVAKSGIAAHWSYKEGTQVDEEVKKTFAWIQNLIENQENIKDPEEFLENVRIDLFPDEVYVFTPNGDVRALPKGATTVDFAYMIHTEVGAGCIGAKVNGRMAPLHHELETGDIVEIVTSKKQRPSKDWLAFVKTVKARSKIRQWIRIQEKDRSLSLGREMCEKAFRKKSLNFNALVKSGEMEKVAGDLGFKNIDNLIANVGYGKITPLQLVHKFAPQKPPESIIDKIMSRVRKKKYKGGVIVKGVDDILIRFGKCCRPVPGDKITGYITRGYGVTVHRTSCVNALKMSSERRIDVQWNEELTDTYAVKILITSLDRVGLLADVAANISKNGANILSVNTKTEKNSKMVDSYFELAVEDTNHLNKVMSALLKVKHVQSVKRLA